MCYIGRTHQRLDARIKQHVPTKIYNFNVGLTDNLKNTYWSSTAKHLIKNHDSTEIFCVNCSPYRANHTLHPLLKYLRQFIFCLADHLSVNRENIWLDLIFFQYSPDTKLFFFYIFPILWGIFFLLFYTIILDLALLSEDQNRLASLSPFFAFFFMLLFSWW